MYAGPAALLKLYKDSGTGPCAQRERAAVPALLDGRAPPFGSNVALRPAGLQTMKCIAVVLAAALGAVAYADIVVQGYADPYCEGVSVGSGVCVRSRRRAHDMPSIKTACIISRL